jgi:ubiquinol-cytochrome c reductase cytochrome c subunit
LSHRAFGVALLSLPFLTAAVFGAARAYADERPPATYREHGVEIGPIPPKDLPANTDIRSLYLRDCATCHGGDAHGTPRGPSLEGVGRASVYYWVSTGRMPLHDDSQRIGRRPPAYPPDVVNGMVDYVAVLAGGGGPDIPTVGTGNVSDGLHLFTLECASCHAWSGSGSIISDGKVPTVVPATPTQAASAIRIGPGEMPAFGPAAFDQQQLNDVVAYIQTLKHKKDSGGFALFHRGPTTEGAAALVLGLGSLFLAIGWIGSRAKARARY